MNNNITIPLSLYIHIPWCIKKCPYCDFNSYEVKEAPIDFYIDSLISDLKQDYARITHRPLYSVFIGGGTPSLLPPKSYEKLLTVIRNQFECVENMEVTLEANPGTIDLPKCVAYKNVGINRLSIGVQSFQDDKLKSLGRIHDAKIARDAIKFAQDAGFENISIDLMYGIQGQSASDAISDLKKALSFALTHISWYQLTIEPNTLFFIDQPKLPEEDVVCAMREEGTEYLSDHGYKQYEIAGYSKGKKWQCKHNVNYWEFGDYLGIGAGAHGKITDLETKTIIRTRKKQFPDEYLAAYKLSLSMLAEEKILTEKELPAEFMMNALRLYKSIPVSLFEERTFLNIQSIEAKILEAKQLKLLNYDGKKITTTKKGKDLLNNTLEFFLH